MAKTNIFQRMDRRGTLLICILLCILSGCGGPSTNSSSGYGDITAPLPVISQGLIYVNTGVLHIFNQRTGAPVNTFHPRNSNLSFKLDPIITSGSIYVVGDVDTTGTYEGVYALQEKTGTEIWQKPIGTISILGTTNGLVYIYAEEENNRNFLMALRMDSGAIRWQYQMNNASDNFTCLVVAPDILYVCPTSTSLIALDAKTGVLLWHRTVTNAVITDAALANGALYVSEKGGISAFKASDGKELWHTALPDYIVAPIVVNSTVYIIDNNGVSSTSYALSTKDGHIIWNHSFANSGRFGKNFFVFSDNIILYADVYNLPYSAHETGKQGASITALRADNGSTLWKNWIGGFADPSLSVSNDTVYAVTLDINSGVNSLHAWQVHTGKQIWEQSITL